MLGSLRRVVAGILLVLVGLALFASQTSTTPGGISLGLVLLVTWGAAGAGVLAGSSWGRPTGLVVSCLGLVIGLSLGVQGVDSPLARVLFSGADAARWYVVMPSGWGLAILSGISAVLLLLPFRRDDTG